MEGGGGGGEGLTDSPHGYEHGTQQLHMNTVQTKLADMPYHHSHVAHAISPDIVT